LFARVRRATETARAKLSTQCRAATLALAPALLGSCQSAPLGSTRPPVATPGSASEITPSEPTARDALSDEPVRLVFVDDFNPPRAPTSEDSPTPGARWDAALHGLSGLHYDRQSGKLYAIADLSGGSVPARLYRFGVELGDSALVVTPESVVMLHERVASPLSIDLDCESVTAADGGAFFVGTENSDDLPTQRAPNVLRVERDGLITGALALPPAFLPEPSGIPTRGPRSNLAFEGLALSPSGRWLQAIVESPLRQDGPVAGFDQPSVVRLLRWDRSGSAPPAEYLYRTEPLPRPRSGTPVGGNNGVSELVSLDDRRLLVLERAYVPLAERQGVNTVRIFEASIPPDVSPGAPQAPADDAARTLPKRLVLDLDDVIERLEPGFQSLDNLEGMTLGPSFPSGEPSLLLVSDDNFRAEQRTVFLAFRVVSGVARPAAGGPLRPTEAR
jgi:hypothetical protein